MLYRDVAARQIDEATGNEEGRHPPRTLLLQQDRRVGDPREAAYARADQNPRTLLRFRSVELQARIGDRLVGRSDGIDDEIIDLALLLRLHPVVRIELALGLGATRNEIGDLAGDVGNFKFLDAPGTVLAG